MKLRNKSISLHDNLRGLQQEEEKVVPQISIEEQKNLKFIQYNQKHQLPKIQKYRQRQFDSFIRDTKFNPSQINMKENKLILVQNVKNHFKVLQSKFFNLKSHLQNQTNCFGILEKLTKNQLLQINKQLEHIIGLFDRICKELTIDFNNIKNVNNFQNPITQEQIQFQASETVLLQSNIFLLSKFDNYLNECFEIYTYNNLLQKEEDLKIKHNNDLIDTMSYTRFIVQNMLFTLQTFENTKKTQQKPLQISIFLKKFVKTTDQKLQNEKMDINTQNIQKHQSISQIEKSNVNKALKIVKQFRKLEQLNNQ